MTSMLLRGCMCEVTLYRQGLVRLPLQRSLFYRLGDAAKLLGVADAIPGGVFGAWLDESGDLFLNRSHVERLVEALLARLTVEHIHAVEQAQRGCCEGLAAATERAAHLASGVGVAELRSLLGELGERIAAILPYGILSKFVPDALLRALAASGDRGPLPFPRPSFGAELAARCLALYRDCLALGWPPERLEAAWPSVEPEVAARVRDFCREQIGYGPLQWEASGYEHPRYALTVLRVAFDGSVQDVGGRLAFSQPEAAGPVTDTETCSDVRRHLAFWLDFLERETWLVRRAFYRGMVPLLRRLAVLGCGGPPGCGVEALLFSEIDELCSGAASADVTPRRREYFADARYLARHGIGPDRLASVFQDT